MELFYHKTDGGAEYYSTTFTVCPNGEKEGTFPGVIMRTDGGEIEKNIPYIPGSIRQDNQEQYDIECDLILRGDKHGGCTWYSVTYIEEDWP